MLIEWRLRLDRVSLVSFHDQERSQQVAYREILIYEYAFDVATQAGIFKFGRMPMNIGRHGFRIEFPRQATTFSPSPSARLL